MCTRLRSYAAGSLSKRRMRRGVSTGPGQIAFTRTLRRANSTASSRDIDSTAPFEDVYAIWDVAAPSRATNDATWITDPPPRLSRCGIPCLQQRKTPRVFTWCTRSHVSGSVSRIEASSAGMIPALL
jgi:hypothetical protein